MGKKWVLFAALMVALLHDWNAISDDSPTFGDPLPTLSSEELDLFSQGKAEFARILTLAEGVGPVFNGRSCVACHAIPVPGGDSGVVEHRFATVTNGAFDPMISFGGPTLQTEGIGHVSSCTFSGETIPPEATIIAERKTTPLFGLGLVESVPDGVFRKIADRQQRKTPDTAGRPSTVTDVTTGLTAVGKFGWKAQVPSLLHFSAEAFHTEMGITNPFFPDDLCPQGNCAALAACDPAADPEDDGSNVQAVADFMRFLAPPSRPTRTSQTRFGESVFMKIGCGDCHLPALKTGRSPVKALNRVKFHPFSDFLIHDMGNLGDGFEQGDATGSEMRTAPLWGLGKRTRFLHDGSASTMEDAVLAHDGQGAASRDRFAALESKDLQNLLAFLASL